MGNKTKIVATIGPATSSKLSIQNLIENGATVLRFNMAYCTRDYVSSLLFLIHSIDPHVAIWLDVDGPKTRTGSFSEPQVTLQKDSHFIFYFAPVVGDCNGCSLNFPRVLGNIGDKVFISDGLVSLTIVDVNEQGVVCSVDNSGTIQPGMSVDVPFFASNLPTLTQKDKEDLAFAMSCNVDYFSVSSLGHIEDIQEIRLLLGNSRIKLLSKIENGAAIQNFEQILKISDGIVIDRGALGVQVQLQTLPASQKRMIQLSNLAGKPVLIAHQVLESMTTGPRPTRSEVSDIHNSIMNGVDALVLSSETATGLNPISTIQMLSKIIFEAEKETNYPEFQQRLMKMCPKPQPTSESIASSSVSCARKTNASLIVCLTELGGTAKLVAKYRPEIPVIGATKVATTARQLNMCFGVKPYYVEGEVDLLKKVIDYAVGLGLVKRGEIVVVTSGQVIGFAEGTTTKMQVVIA